MRLFVTSDHPHNDDTKVPPVPFRDDRPVVRVIATYSTVMISVVPPRGHELMTRWGWRRVGVPTRSMQTISGSVNPHPPAPHSCRVEAARPMHAGAGMGGRGAEVDAGDRRAVAEVGEDGAPEELVREVGAAAAEVAADQVFVHRFQIVRREDRPATDELAKPRRQAFDALLDAVGERFLVRPSRSPSPSPGYGSLAEDGRRRWHANTPTACARRLGARVGSSSDCWPITRYGLLGNFPARASLVKRTRSSMLSPAWTTAA